MEQLDKDITRAVQNLPGISVLVVFGSRARGTQRPDSDLDVAVLPPVWIPEAAATSSRILPWLSLIWLPKDE